MTAEEKQMQDMQANLKDSGMSGTMYRREDLAGMMDKMGDLEKMYGGGSEADDAATDPEEEEGTKEEL